MNEKQQVAAEELQRLNRAYEAAKAQRDPEAMIAATMEKARLAGICKIANRYLGACASSLSPTQYFVRAIVDA